VTLKLGTRGSDLARTQAATVAARLEALGHSTELELIRTSGDRSSAPSFGAIGPQGVFVREIEQALADGRVDLAVHSYKDLPTKSPDGLAIAAVPARLDPADVLVVRETHYRPGAAALLPLAEGARVGTAAARRRAWLMHFRPDLVVESVRGNVPTRLARLGDGQFDAIVLAAAGVDRLVAGSHALDGAFDGLVRIRLDPERFVPAPAQGALAVQCRRGDARVTGVVSPLDDPASRAAVDAERKLLALAEAGCDAAFGAYCRPAGDGFELIAMLERAGRIVTAAVQHTEPGLLAERAWAACTAGAA
jgi:hydroxymethylbilane synthase